MAVRDEIVWKSGIVYFAVAVIAIVLLVRIIILQYVYRTDEVQATRGDILTYDGRLLASSVPYYSIYMDTRSSGMSSEIWSSGIDGLCAGLSRIIGERSPSGWKSVLTN